MCVKLLFLCTIRAAARTTPAFKRRRGGAWSSITTEISRAGYYAGETHTNSVHQQKGAVIDKAKAFERHKKAKAASAASHTTSNIDDEGNMSEYDMTNLQAWRGHGGVSPLRRRLLH